MGGAVTNASPMANARADLWLLLCLHCRQKVDSLLPVGRLYLCGMVGPFPGVPHSFGASRQTYGPLFVRCDVCRRYARL